MERSTSPLNPFPIWNGDFNFSTRGEDFVRERWRGSIALIATGLTWIALHFTTSEAREWLAADYGIGLDILIALYGGLTLISAGICVFDPRIRAELRAGQPLVIFLAAISLILLLSILIPDPLRRLMRHPFPLGVIILHAAVLALLAADSVYTPNSVRAQRYAAFVLTGCLIALAIAHVLGVGVYMALDLPDEVELASLAVSAADTGVMDRTYIGSAFGVPDPVAPHYYTFMGMWLRLTSVSNPIAQFEQMRVFSLRVGVGAVMLMAFALTQIRGAKWMNVLVGLVVMLAWSAFARTSHNIRPDIGLALASAFTLFGLILILERGKRIGLVLIGIAFWIALETIPTAGGVCFGVVTLGILTRLIAWRTRPRTCLIDAVILIALFGLAAALYAVPRFIIDPTGWTRFREYLAYYASLGNLAAGVDVVGYYVRFNLHLAPLELLTIGGVVAFALWKGTPIERRIIGIGIASVIAVIVTIGGTYGYLAWFAPFVAYAAALAFRSERIRWLLAFVLLPALVIVPIRDMLSAYEYDANRREIAEADLLTWQIPPDTTVIGENIFWFTLHSERRFIGWNGVSAYASARGLDDSNALRELDADYLICLETCALIPDAVLADYAEPFDFTITRGTYRVYPRAD